MYTAQLQCTLCDLAKTLIELYNLSLLRGTETWQGNPLQVELLGRALLQPGVDERIVVVRDDEPTSLLAYALSSKYFSQSPISCPLVSICPCGRHDIVKSCRCTHTVKCALRVRLSVRRLHDSSGLYCCMSDEVGLLQGSGPHN